MSEPTITQTFEPERTTLTLSLRASATKSDGKKVTVKSDGKKVTAKTTAQKQIIIEYLTNKVSATSQEIADVLGVGLSRAKTILRALIAEDVIVAEGADKNRTYRLKR